MRLLIDTNVLLEILLEQDRMVEAKNLLSAVQAHEFFISDFSLHSIGVLLFRHQQFQIFNEFVGDLIVEGAFQIITLTTSDLDALAEAGQNYRLDFDDAYQYALAQAHDLTIVSFDDDFDRTPRGRKTPADILARSTDARDE